jgi:hypothetical protein
MQNNVYYCASNVSGTLPMIQTTALICAAYANAPPHFPNPGERVMLVQAELPDDGHIESYV